MQKIKSQILIFSLFIISIFLSFLFSPLVANALSGVNYYWSVRAVFEQGQVQGEMIRDKEWSKWDESLYQAYQGKATNAKDAGITNSSFLSNTTNKFTHNPLNIKEAEVINNQSGSYVSNSYKPFSFPGIDGLDGGDERENDLAQANKINTRLISDFNTALSFFQSSNGDVLVRNNLSGTDGRKAFLTAIAKLGVNEKVYPGMGGTQEVSVSYNGTSYYLQASSLSNEDATKIYNNSKKNLIAMGIISSGDSSSSAISKIKKYFIKVAPGKSTKWTYLQWMYPKGYGEGEPLYSDYKSQGVAGMTDEYVPDLSWFHVALNALSSYSVGIYSANSSDLYSAQGTLVTAIVELFNSLFNTIVGLIGAVSIDDLIFGIGDRIDYYYGIAPESWFTNLSFVLIVSYVVALTILGVAFVKNFAMGNLSILNPAAKANVMNGLMNILYAILGITFYIPCISLLFSLNKAIVGFCLTSSNGITFSNALLTGGTSLGSLISSFILMFFTIKLNIMYIIRSLYIVTLYTTGPLFITSIGFSSKKSELFKAWLKELLGQLFLQSFHAIILLIYIKMGATGGILQQCVLAYSFVPFGKLFRDKLLQFGGSSVDSLNNGRKPALLGATTSALGGVLGGAIGGAIANPKLSKDGTQSVVASGMANAEGSQPEVFGDKKSSMMDNDKNFETIIKGLGNIAKAGAMVGASAMVAGLGGNNRNMLQGATNVLGYGFGQLANGVINGGRGMAEKSGVIKTAEQRKAEAIQRQKEFNNRHGLSDGVMSNGIFNGHYNTDIEVQTYLGPDGVEHDMHLTPSYDSSSGTECYDADFNEIVKDENNPMYDLAKYYTDKGVENPQTLSQNLRNPSTAEEKALAEKYSNFQFTQLEKGKTNHVGIKIKDGAVNGDYSARSVNLPDPNNIKKKIKKCDISVKTNKTGANDDIATNAQIVSQFVKK